MKIPCEMMVKRVLPVFRAVVAESLINDHGLTQTEAADKLGITQAAISQYLRDKRGHKAGSEEVLAAIHNIAGDYASKLVTVSKEEEAVCPVNLCKVCPNLVKEIARKTTLRN